MGSLTYDEAVVMLAALASASDGQPQPQEDAVIAKQLAPVLRRLGPDRQRATMALLRELLSGIGMENTLTSIRGAMVSPRDRLDAVRMVAGVVFADGHVGPQEANHLAELAHVMGLSEAEFRSVLPPKAGGPKPAAAKGPEPANVDEARLMLAVLAGSADGVPQEEELRSMDKNLSATLQRLGTAGKGATLARLVLLVRAKGLDGALEAIRVALPTHQERHDAVRVAAGMVLADGRVTPQEKAHLERVGFTMGLSAAEMARMLAH